MSAVHSFCSYSCCRCSFFSCCNNSLQLLLRLFELDLALSLALYFAPAMVLSSYSTCCSKGSTPARSVASASCSCLSSFLIAYFISSSCCFLFLLYLKKNSLLFLVLSPVLVSCSCPLVCLLTSFFIDCCPGSSLCSSSKLDASPSIASVPSCSVASASSCSLASFPSPANFPVEAAAPVPVPVASLLLASVACLLACLLAAPPH